MALKLGIHAGQQDCSYEDLRRLWRLADSSGFHWVSIWDHFYDNPSIDGKGDCFEAVSTLAALASETSKVRIGCLVFSVTYRNPAVLAKAAATIDHISNGRLELGLGAGWYELEHTAYGVPFPPVRTRLDMLEEGVQIVTSMLAQESTTFTGRHFRVEDAYCNPKPIQKRPRIWIGGKGERRTLRLAARYAGGWNAPYISSQEYKRKIHVLDQWCDVEGRNPTEITRSVNVGFYMGTDATDAARKRRSFYETWGAKAEERSEGMLFGTSSQVVDRVGVYAGAGAQGLNLAVRAPFDWEALQAFIEEVLPVFQQEVRSIDTS